MEPSINHSSATMPEADLVARLRAEIADNGYVHFRKPMTRVNYELITSLMGEVVGEDDIKLNVTKRKLHSPQGLPFHTDSAVANLISWFCIETGSAPAPTTLLDTRAILAQFRADERQLLEQVTMRCPNRTHDMSYPAPLLSYHQGQPQIFFTPWFPLPDGDEAVNAAEHKFRQLVESSPELVVPVTLAVGETLIIDNKRMLHGRNNIEPGTSRWLARRWLATQGYDDRLVH